MKWNAEEKIKLMEVASVRASEGYESKGDIGRITWFYEKMLDAIENPEKKGD